MNLNKALELGIISNAEFTLYLQMRKFLGTNIGTPEDPFNSREIAFINLINERLEAYQPDDCPSIDSLIEMSKLMLVQCSELGEQIVQKFSQLPKPYSEELAMQRIARSQVNYDFSLLETPDSIHEITPVDVKNSSETCLHKFEEVGCKICGLKDENCKHKPMMICSLCGTRKRGNHGGWQKYDKKIPISCRVNPTNYANIEKFILKTKKGKKALTVSDVVNLSLEKFFEF